jgi:hypothetical protein
MTQLNLDITTEYLLKIADRLESAAKDIRGHTAHMQKTGNYDEVQSIINTLLWLTPNLGIQAVLGSLIRELEREKA